MLGQRQSGARPPFELPNLTAESPHVRVQRRVAAFGSQRQCDVMRPLAAALVAQIESKPCQQSSSLASKRGELPANLLGLGRSDQIDEHPQMPRYRSPHRASGHQVVQPALHLSNRLQLVDVSHA
ncbi:hypothetical protein GCM10022236_43520 [Microlunatus ginsengisoli]|uniref:Uncharacterized protein n=1 Tax=Microlunatus ginsengisoli TaxID=363863 RepID=A0ABP7AMG7_9ACTN